LTRELAERFQLKHHHRLCREAELAMEIAMGAIGPLLPKLGSLLVGEFTLEKRVRKAIDSLMTELTLMHAALRKVAKVPPEQLEEGVKIWAGNVKELSYQMEDIVDTFLVRVEGGGIEPATSKNKVKKLLKKTIRLFNKGRDLYRISNALGLPQCTIPKTSKVCHVMSDALKKCLGTGLTACALEPRN
jgi:hypothetical protein